MTNYSDEVIAEIDKVAAARNVTPETVREWVDRYNVHMGRVVGVETQAAFIVELAAEHCDPNDPRNLVKGPALGLRRIAVTYWAKAAGAHVPDVVAAFDAGANLTTIAADYPVRLPLDSNGLIDADAFFNADYLDNLERAIMFDLQANIAEASVWGGDDNWFDYLPNGILQLQSIQDEGWARTWADIWNTHPAGIGYNDPDGPTDEQDELNNEAEERIAEQYGFYIQDVTSDFIYALMRPRMI